MKDDLLALAWDRMHAAEATPHEARTLQGTAQWPGAISRGYYAMFHSASALLATRGLGTSKHAGVISLLHREFMHVGLFDKVDARHLEQAFRRRLDADYADDFNATAEDTEQVIAWAERFIDRATQTLWSLDDAHD